MIEQDNLAIVDCTQQSVPVLQSGEFSWDVLISRIEKMIKRVDAKRVAIDSIGTAFVRFSQVVDEQKVRELLFSLMDKLKAMNVTVMISGEKTARDAALSRYGIEEFVSDGAVTLELHSGQNKTIRIMSVIKLRGLDYRSGKVEYEISPSGLTVFPKIPVDINVAETNFDVRLKTGINELDQALRGGIPQGHVMLIAGNTGVGKTLLGMQFIYQGLNDGEKCVFVALEEPTQQILKTANAHGWNFEKYQKKNELIFIREGLLDISTDQLLYRIVRAVERINANHVVIDSVSSLESSSMDRNKVREFLIQASTFFKTRGVTCYMNYLSGDTFGAGVGQLLGSLTTNEMRLSSIVDGIILMRYVERDESIHKMLNIFKLRGSDHNRNILHYEIKRGGIKLGERFKAK